MNLPNSFWENEDGSWTLASELVRELCRAERFDHEIEPVELYFILDCFGVKKRFADYWDYPEFYQRADAAHIALEKSITTSNSGWSSRRGDKAWAIGNLKLAESFFQDEMRKHRESGYNGLFRLRFAQGRFSECVEIFKNTCPAPRSSYKAFFEHGASDIDNISAGRFTSPDFISTGKRMLQVVVFASVQSGFLDDELKDQVCRYFSTDKTEIDKLAQTCVDGAKEFERLKKRVAPKPMGVSRSLTDLIRDGKTARALHICSRLSEYAELVQKLSYEISEFVQTGEKALIDQCVKTSLFNIQNLDRVLYHKALSIITSESKSDFSRDIILARQFGLTIRYGKSNHAFFDNVRWWKDVYGASFAAGWKLLPIDIVIGISRINWYKQPEFADSHFLIERFEWASTFLVEYLDRHLKVGVFDSDKSVLSFLQNAYLVVYSRFEEAQSESRWVSEELLAKAIESLFGKGSVVQHAQPIWLIPQHLDIFVPEHNLAIEYMGKQHYEPVEIFGGEDGFEKTKERDERKLNICNKVGVSLEYVTHVEDIGKRAKEIHKKHSQISLPSGKG